MFLPTTAAHDPALAAACTGYIQCASAKVTELGTFLRVASSVVAIGFVVWRAIASRGAMATIIIAGLCAGFFVWIVFNVANLQDRTNQEINGGMPPTRPRDVLVLLTRIPNQREAPPTLLSLPAGAPAGYGSA